MCFLKAYGDLSDMVRNFFSGGGAPPTPKGGGALLLIFYFFFLYCTYSLREQFTECLTHNKIKGGQEGAWFHPFFAGKGGRGGMAPHRKRALKCLFSFLR